MDSSCMDGNKRSMDRRTVLQAIGVGAVGIPSTAMAANNDEESDSVRSETIRGQSDKPVTIEQIEAVRKRFTKTYSANGETSEYTLVNAEEAFGDKRIYGYNIIGTESDGPKEQYVTRAVSSGNGAVSTNGAGPDTEKRLHEKADELLNRATTEMSASTESEVQASSSEYDIPWSDWYSLGSTDVYNEYPAKSHNWGESRPGMVEIESDVRSSPDDPRVGARTRIRMEPGRQICNSSVSNSDEYCIPGSTYNGWRNRSATVFHDWDQFSNGTPTDELIEDYDPTNNLGDLTTSRTASMSLNVARDPSLSVGYSTSVAIPGAELVDKTTKATGQTKHSFVINSVGSNSSTQNAEFEVGSVAEYEPDCASFGTANFLDIDIDLGWGIPNSVPYLKWLNTSSDSEHFYYDRYCAP